MGTKESFLKLNLSNLLAFVCGCGCDCVCGLIDGGLNFVAAGFGEDPLTLGVFFGESLGASLARFFRESFDKSLDKSFAASLDVAFADSLGAGFGESFGVGFGESLGTGFGDWDCSFGADFGDWDCSFGETDAFGDVFGAAFGDAFDFGGDVDNLSMDGFFLIRLMSLFELALFEEGEMEALWTPEYLSSSSIPSTM